MKMIFSLLLLSVLSFSAMAKSSQRANTSAKSRSIFAPSKHLTVHCNFQQPWKPSAYLRYDADRRRVWVESGWPHVWHRYENVGIIRGLPPFNQQGITLMASDDMPIVSFRIGTNPNNWESHFENYEIQAAWGFLQGMPRGRTGQCRAETQPFKSVAAAKRVKKTKIDYRKSVGLY
jgi:hypothetical protein